MKCKKCVKDPVSQNATSLITESDGAVFSVVTTMWFCKVCKAPMDAKTKATQLSKGN